MNGPTPLGRDAATRNMSALVAAIESAGVFGKPQTQSGSDGNEKLFRCPLCAEEGKDTKGRQLRVARRKEGGSSDLPYVGCRQHDGPGSWERLRTALISGGVPGDLLEGGTGRSGQIKGSARAARPDGSAGGGGGFPERGDGLGEEEPIPDENVEEWADRLWDGSSVSERRLEYLRKRGLDDEMIQHAQLGIGKFPFQAGKKGSLFITIPIRDAEGTVVNVRLASLKPGVKRMPIPHPTLRKYDGEGNELPNFVTYGRPTRLFGVDRIVAEDPDWVFFVAGEWDKLLGEQHGLYTVAGTGGEKALPRMEDAKELAGRNVVVVYDCDPAGRSGAEKVGRALLALGCESVRVLDLDPDREDGYDLGDFLADGGDVDEILQMAASLPEWVDPNPEAGRKAPAWQLNDYGVAEQILFRARRRLRYVQEMAAWLSWDPERGMWEEYPKGDYIAPANEVYSYAGEIRTELADAEEGSAEEAWKGHLSRYLDNSKNTSAVRVMSHMEDFRERIHDLDAKPDLLNLQNGTMDLRTRTMREARPEDLLTKSANGSWDPHAAQWQKGEWGRFLRRFIPDRATREWIQQAVGYSLLDGNPRRLLIILKGPGGTGKTTFAEILQRVFGPYAGPINLSLFRDSQDERPRADLIAAMTRRIVFASETSAAWKLHVDQLKRLTGNETIAARLPHSPKLFERRPAFTPWVLTNDTPTVDGVDAPFFRRLVVVPFHTIISEQEEGADYVSDVLDEIRDSVITWALEGLWKYLDNGSKLPEKSKPMMLEEMEVREQFNSMTVFLAHHTMQGSDYRVKASDLYQAYENYCMESGVHDRDRFNKIEFGKRLGKLGPYKTCKVDSKDRGWSGLRLRGVQ